MFQSACRLVDSGRKIAGRAASRRPAFKMRTRFNSRNLNSIKKFCYRKLTHDEVDLWHAAQQRLALLLRHAAGHHDLHLAHARALALRLLIRTAWVRERACTVSTSHKHLPLLRIRAQPT